MKPNETSVKLATFIDSMYQDAVSKKVALTIDEITEWIEDTYGDSVTSRLRRKVKNQRAQLKQLHRAHTVLVHEAADWIKEKLIRKDVKEYKDEVAKELSTIPDGAPVPVSKNSEAVRLRRMGF